MKNRGVIQSIQDKIQNEALSSLSANSYNGGLAMCTGAGKSKSALMAADDVNQLYEGNADIFLAVPTEKLRDKGWEEECTKWECLDIYKRMDRNCYVSMMNIKGKHYHLVILDEAHNITPNSYQFFINNKVDRVIWLTATVPEEEDKRILLDSLAPVRFVYNLDQGVKDGVVAPYSIKVIESNLDSVNKTVRAGSKTSPFMTTESQYYNWLSTQILKLRFSNNPNLSTFKTFERMRFIYNLPSKQEIAKKIIKEKLLDDRSLIFCGSRRQATELCPNYFFSKPDKKKEPDLFALWRGDVDLDAFKAGEIDKLACIEALNEGHNLPNLDSGLIVQLNSKERDLVQRIGRLIRARDGHSATLYIQVCLNTQDQVWCEKAITSFDKTRVEYINAKNL